MKKIKFEIKLFINKTFFTFIIFFFIQNCFSQESWIPTSMVNVPSARYEHSTIWTGTALGGKMIIWGGHDSTGGIYDPVANSWWATSLINAPSGRGLHTAIWTENVLGGKMIIWGGQLDYYIDNLTNTGGIYDPISNNWQSTSIVNVPFPRRGHTAIWTESVLGGKMIIWGGECKINDSFYVTNTGGIYDPVTNSWQPISTVNAPTPRMNHTAIWTGTKMIIWGGHDENGDFDNTGGIYDPITDSWNATSVVNAPIRRSWHSAIWTGSKMIIWGGDTLNGAVKYSLLNITPQTNTGGIYDIQTDSWTATSIVNAPSSRSGHSAIWTGIRMIIWGGIWINNTGGIYDPVTNAWQATTITNAPSPRDSHSCVWTNTKMIVWGGEAFFQALNTGGIYYNPSVIGINKIGEIISTNFELFQNYPNPFNPSTKIKFNIRPPLTPLLTKEGMGLPAEASAQAGVVLEIYDILGRKIATIVNGILQPGTYEVEWDASNFASGLYFYQLIVDNQIIETKKMILEK